MSSFIQSFSKSNKKTVDRAGGGRVEILTFSLGATRMDKIRRDYIRGTAEIQGFEDKG